MDIKIDRESFEKIGRIFKEQQRLDDFGYKGWLSTTYVFEKHFGKYQSDNPEHKQIFRKLIKSLELKSKSQFYEILYDEDNLGYKGTYFREEVCKELDEQIQNIKDTSKANFIEKIISFDF